MNIFKLEEYLTKYEFSAPYLLCCSDAESMTMQDLLKLADQDDLKRWEQLTLQYTEPYGMPALRSQIAANSYEDLSDRHILCFAGAEEGIYVALTVLCQPGDHAIVLTPCYQSLFEVAANNGAKVTTVALQEYNHWKIDLPAIANAITSQTKCIIINFPHNPTGQVLTPQELNDLIALCDQHGLWLFSDEVYRGLGSPDNGWAPCAADVYPKALSLGVMSKAFGMAGLRIGWIACQDTAMLEKFKRMKDYLSICNSAPSEILAMIALKNKGAILARNNQIIAENLTLLNHFFEKYQHLFSWVKPQGGCVGLVHYQSDESVDDFCARLVKETGVLLMPASVYDLNSNHFRIGFGRKNMPEALDKLNSFISCTT